MKKQLTISMAGRRTKQAILNDVVRPSASSTISSPITTSTGFSSPNVPGCVGTAPIIRHSCGDATDIFDRDVLVGWGGASSGGFSEWTYDQSCKGASLSATATANVSGGNALLHNEPIGDDDFAGALVKTPISFADSGLPMEVLVKFKILEIDTTYMSETNQQVFVINTRVAVNNQDDCGLGTTSGIGFSWYEHVLRDLPEHWFSVAANGFSSDAVEIPEPVVDRQYYVRIFSDPHGTTAIFWDETIEEDEGYSATFSTGGEMIPPFMSMFISDVINSGSPIVNGPMTIAVQAVTINPSSAVGTSPCSPPSNLPGNYLDTLYHQQYYWRTQSTTNVTIQQVYFDGMPVTLGTEYTIEDGYKVVPVDASLSYDTVVTALITVG